jgi:hypothetical protein
MNRQDTLSQLRLPLELIDIISSYDSYDLFDYYGVNKSCPIIQKIMQTKKNLQLLLSKKAEYSVCNIGGDSWCTYSCLDQSKKTNLDYTICSDCGNYHQCMSIHLGQFIERDFFQDLRMCHCYISLDFLEELTFFTGRNYMV